MDEQRITSIDLSTVEKMAELARLALTDAEKQAYSKQLSAIIEHFNMLGEVNVDGVPPAYLLNVGLGVMRADEPGASMERDDLLGCAPQRQGEFVRTAKVF